MIRRKGESRFLEKKLLDIYGSRVEAVRSSARGCFSIGDYYRVGIMTA